MAWTFTNAVRHGVVAVTVNAEDDSIIDEEERRKARKYWRYGYDTNEQTPTEFKAMVRQEIRAHLDHMNASVVDTDVTPDYEDL